MCLSKNITGDDVDSISQIEYSMCWTQGNTSGFGQYQASSAALAVYVRCMYTFLAVSQLQVESWIYHYPEVYKGGYKIIYKK